MKSKTKQLTSGKKNDAEGSNYLKRIFERFIKIRGTPREIAMGFALGLFVGFTPTMGFQMPIAVFFAALLKWNKISAAIGVWITNPFTAVFIYSFCYFIGAKLLGYQVSVKLAAGLSLEKLFHLGPQIILATTLGGIIIGLPVALLGYYLSFNAVHGYQTKLKEKLVAKKDKLVKKIKSRRKARRKRKTAV